MSLEQERQQENQELTLTLSSTDRTMIIRAVAKELGVETHMDLSALEATPAVEVLHIFAERLMLVEGGITPWALLAILHGSIYDFKRRRAMLASSKLRTREEVAAAMQGTEENTRLAVLCDMLAESARHELFYWYLPLYDSDEELRAAIVSWYYKRVPSRVPGVTMLLPEQDHEAHAAAYVMQVGGMTWHLLSPPPLDSMTPPVCVEFKKGNPPTCYSAVLRGDHLPLVDERDLAGTVEKVRRFLETYREQVEQACTIDWAQTQLLRLAARCGQSGQNGQNQ